MVEIYWLTRLDGLLIAAEFMTVIAVVALVMSLSAKVVFGTLDDEDSPVPKWLPKMSMALLIVSGRYLSPLRKMLY